MRMTPIHVTRWGTQGPLVIMIHGSIQGNRVGGDGYFRSQATLQDRGWQVSVPDRPGHGLSPAPGRPDDAEEDGRWVAELMGDGAHLVGHSFGGNVALFAAAMRPASVRSLTIIEPAMWSLAGDDVSVKRFTNDLLAINASGLSPADAVSSFLKLVGSPAAVSGGKSPEELGQMWESLKQLKTSTFAQLSERISTVRAARIPFQVIDGGWNPAFGAITQRLAKLAAARHLVIECAHHNLQMSDEFNDVLAAFMTEADLMVETHSKWA